MKRPAFFVVHNEQLGNRNFRAVSLVNEFGRMGFEAMVLGSWRELELRPYEGKLIAVYDSWSGRFGWRVRPIDIGSPQWAYLSPARKTVVISGHLVDLPLTAEAIIKELRGGERGASASAPAKSVTEPLRRRSHAQMVPNQHRR